MTDREDNDETRPIKAMVAEQRERTRAEWRKVAEELLRCAEKGKLARSTAAKLADALGDALDGFPPLAWERAPRHGNVDRLEWHPEIGALNYIAAARQGLVSDPTPIKTIMAEFGLKSRRTVDRWKIDPTFKGWKVLPPSPSGKDLGPVYVWRMKYAAAEHRRRRRKKS